MAASLGSYVDELPGLSPEELERALEATETPRAAAPAPAPQPAEAAPMPAPAPPAPPVPGAAPDAPIQRSAKTGFREQVRDYQDQEIEDANKRLELADRAGDETAMMHTKAAGLRHEQADEARTALDTAKSDAAEHRQKRKDYETRADQVYDEMAASKRPPDRSMVEKVMGVLGGLAALGGHSSGAQGFQLIGSLFAPDRDQWAREQESNSKLYQMASRGIDVNNASEEHDYTMASRVAAAKAHEIDAAIDAVKEEGLGEAGMRAADELKLNVRQQARGFLTKAAEDEEAARLKAEADAEAARLRAAKAKRAGELSRKEQWFWNRSLEELDQMPNDVLGEVGQKVRTEMRKAQQSGESGALENLQRRKKLVEEELKGDGLAREGDLTPTGRAIKDPKVYNQLSVTEKTKLAEADDAATSLTTNIDKLLKLRADHGFEVGRYGSDEYNTAQVLNKKIHLALKKADTLGTLDKGSVEFLEEMTGDPNSWFGAPESKLKAIKDSVVGDVETRAQRAGLAGARAARAPEDDPRVRKGHSGASAASRGVDPRRVPAPTVTLDQVREAADAQERRDRFDDETQDAMAKFLR